MWASIESGVAVYFTDVKSLVRGESICGNVSCILKLVCHALCLCYMKA